MKALFASLVLSALLAPVLSAQENAAPAAKEEPAAAPAPTPAAAEPAPAPAAPVPPIEGAAPSAAESTSDLTPAKEEPVAIPDPNMELLPSADPGTPQILPEPALIPVTPEMTERPEGSAIAPPSTTEPPRPAGPSKTELAATELAEKIRYRQVKTRALGDPAVQEEWRKAQTARTDAEKRAGLKRYYQALYGRMAKIDKSLEKRIAERKQISLRRLQQNRIQASVVGNSEDSQEEVQAKPPERLERVQISADGF